MSLPTKSVYQQNFPSQSGNKPFGVAPGKIDNTKREPMKCWGCGEEHLLRDCPHRQKKIIGGSTTSKRLPQSMMWLGACHKFMQPWIIDKLTTKL
jgi:hypothetical protein